MRYLLVTYIRKADGQIDEAVTLSKKIKTSDHQTVNVILDYAEKRVVKCVIEGRVVDTDWEKLSGYYAQIYPAIDRQLNREAATIAKAEPETSKVEDDTQAPITDSDQA